MPPEIGSATNVIIDLITGAVASDQRPLFDNIESRRNKRLAPELPVAA